MNACCGPSRPTSDGTPSLAPAAENLENGALPDLGLVAIDAGRFLMGTDDSAGYSDDGEGPVHEVDLAAFSIARHAVTNDAFADFVAATGYITTAERLGDSFVFAGLLPDDFPPTQGVVLAPWWRLVERADWRHPEGPQSDLGARGTHPVVHVSWLDAEAYCQWSGTSLPTEAQWERAARGGLESVHFPWGDEREPDGLHRMNVFQGEFPSDNSGEDGWIGTCPVESFLPNGFGLYEMTGNVWELCSDWFDPAFYSHGPPVDPSGPEHGDRRVMRGGSYLCHESYCWRYRVDARSSTTVDSTAGNIGFRVTAEANDPRSAPAGEAAIASETPHPAHQGGLPAAVSFGAP